MNEISPDINRRNAASITQSKEVVKIKEAIKVGVVKSSVVFSGASPQMVR